MSLLPIDKLVQCLINKKYDEFDKIIAPYKKRELSETEKGQYLLDLGIVNTKVQTLMAQKRLEEIDVLDQVMKELDKELQDLEDKSKIKAIKDSIK